MPAHDGYATALALARAGGALKAQTPDGLRVSRVKGSRDNVVRWTPRLRAAWSAALAIRTETLARPKNRARPVPIRPEDRYVFVNQSGGRLSKGEYSGNPVI